MLDIFQPDRLERTKNMFARMIAIVVVFLSSLSTGFAKPTITPRPVRMPYLFVPLPSETPVTVTAISPNGQYIAGVGATQFGVRGLVWKYGLPSRALDEDAIPNVINNYGVVGGQQNGKPYIDYNIAKGGTVNTMNGEIFAVTSANTAYGYVSNGLSSSAFRFDSTGTASYPFGWTEGVHTNYLAANDQGTAVFSRTVNYATRVYAEGSSGTKEVRAFGFGSVRIEGISRDEIVFGTAFDGTRMNPFLWHYPTASYLKLRSLEIDSRSWATPYGRSGNLVVGVDDCDSRPSPTVGNGYRATAIIWQDINTRPVQLDTLVFNGKGIHLTEAVGIADNGVIAVNAIRKDGRTCGGYLVPRFHLFK